MIDVHSDNLTMRVNDEQVHFNIYHTMKFHDRGQSCNRISVVDECVKGVVDGVLMDDHLDHCLVHSSFQKTCFSASDMEFNDFDGEDKQLEFLLALDSLPNVSNQ